MITIIDYGAGNIKSILNMLKKMGSDAIITKERKDIEDANKLILPGVGHFDYGMKNLRNTGLIETLNEKVLKERTPILGICLGAQMLGYSSDEGSEPGLGWIDMNVIKFRFSNEQYKVPHMNWNEIDQKKESKLFDNMFQNPRFYFVHSYHMKPNVNEDILCTSAHGINFVSGVEKENIYGVQFHPEKSHKYGMKLLENFSKI